MPSEVLRFIFFLSLEHAGWHIGVAVNNIFKEQNRSRLPGRFREFCKYTSKSKQKRINSDTLLTFKGCDYFETLHIKFT